MYWFILVMPAQIRNQVIFRSGNLQARFRHSESLDRRQECKGGEARAIAGQFSTPFLVDAETLSLLADDRHSRR